MTELNDVNKSTLVKEWPSQLELVHFSCGVHALDLWDLMMLLCPGSVSCSRRPPGIHTFLMLLLIECQARNSQLPKSLKQDPGGVAAFHPDVLICPLKEIEDKRIQGQVLKIGGNFTKNGMHVDGRRGVPLNTRRGCKQSNPDVQSISTNVPKSALKPPVLALNSHASYRPGTTRHLSVLEMPLKMPALLPTISTAHPTSFLPKRNNIFSKLPVTPMLPAVTSKYRSVRSIYPQTISSSYTVRVPAGGALGETIFTIPDRRYRGKWFEISWPSNPPVKIESGSGRLYLTHKLQGGETEIQVKVHNLEQGGDWYLCHITIVVPREESLEWTMYPFPYLACVDPEAPKGTFVYQLLAHYYNDESSGGGISYHLMEGADLRFEVDKDTGIISTTGLPLMWNKEYALTVQATDKHGKKSPYASISILVGLRPPQFTNMSYSLFVPENTAIGEKMAVVEAVSFQGKSITYTLLMNPSGLFSINQDSGELSLTHAVDYESEHHLYHLLVKALEAESVLSSVTEVLIHITDDNDCSPEFHKSIYSQDNILENIPVGTSILQVTAQDCDSGSNAEISYFAQSSEFSITSEGVILSSQRLDYEQANHMYEFVVIAIDEGDPPRTGTASVRLRMSNINDEAPVFSQNVYNTFLSEDAGPNTLVATVHAKDPDGDNVLYFIVEGNEEGNFDLDSQKGILRLRRTPLPRLLRTQYILNISAVDDNSSGGPSTLSSFTQVIVGINDVNNNKPTFRECFQYSENSWVLENQPPGTFVLQVEAHDADTGLNGEVKYGLMHREGAIPAFAIDAYTGVITTTQSFDREKQREYTISVTATDQAEEPLIGVCQIAIFVVDLNDNDPKFENSHYQYFLREDTPIGTSFLRVAAIDDDQGVNAAITYTILAQQPEYFQINPSTGWVYVNYPISQISRITRQIIATDGGNRSSSVELSVTITNVLNQPPQWEQARYWVSIPENITRDSKIVTVKAASLFDDPRVTYNMEEGLVPETNNPIRFYLKPNRADGSTSILVSEPLDYEGTKFFTLRIRAQNVATVPLASFTTVYINVTDVNDNVPFFTSSTYEVTLPEAAEIGSSIIEVRATDQDSGLHGKVRYVLLKDVNEDYQCFTINPETGVIYTATLFDREKQASYLIEIQSEDSTESARPGMQGHPNTDTAYVRIFVSDVNDNAPMFPQQKYETSVEEDKDVGYVVMTVSAIDEDEGANAKLRYQITSGNAKGIFDVEPEIGRIFITQRLNYEQDTQFELKLVASDGKWENHTSVIINVINLNDEPPVFTQSEYHDSILEELTDLPMLVLQVSATDPDQEADQSALRYTLHGQGANSEFVIDQFSGKIYVHKKLDREQRSTWRFLVLATDENGEGLTGFADVIIDIKDINDNPPVFLCTCDGCFVGYIPENSPADTTIMEMTAFDLDDPKSGKNAILTYRIVQNVKNEINLNLFAIHPSTGSIYNVLGSLDREKEDRYLIVIEAKDGGGLTGTGTATILVSDVNDHAPVFAQKIYTAFVPESSGINSEVTVLQAWDNDEGENAMMVFSIIGGDDDRKFFIETDKIHKRGIIRLRKRMDFEKPHERSFNLTIKVEDMDFFNIAYCIIHVEDSNDHAPLFYPHFYNIAPLPENVPVGTTVVRISAMDLDSGLNGIFSYHILNSSDPNGQFSLVGDGYVMVSKPLDREISPYYRLVVLATDMGEPALTGSTTIFFNLEDINDNAPGFESQYSPMIWENTDYPHVVQINKTSTLLYAVDNDTTENGPPFSFYLLTDPQSTNDFSLKDFHNGSAMITALRSFDRELQKVFYLPILITDSGNPPLTSTNTLTILIGDRNDHPHSSGHMDCTVFLYKGILPTVILGKVPSLDLDDWEHKMYYLESKSRIFSVHDSSGLLTIREGAMPGVYKVRVRVADGVWPDVVSTVKVVLIDVTEEDVNNAIAIRLKGLNAEQFIAQTQGMTVSKYEQMKNLLSEIISCAKDNVQIFSVLNIPNLPNSTDVWISISRPPYHLPENLNGIVALHRDKLESAMGVQVTQVGEEECRNVQCSHKTGCVIKNIFKHTPTMVRTDSVSVGSVTIATYVHCSCASREHKHFLCSSYAVNPCFNGGTCIDTELGYRCECSPAYYGPECQQTKRSFTGQGFAWFPPMFLCFESQISLDFITEETDGLLLYNGPMASKNHGESEDFIAVELQNGSPSLVINHGSGSLLLKFTKKRNVSDRRWHNLKILSNGKKVKLILDHCSKEALVDGATSFYGIPEDRSWCEVSGETPGKKRFLNVYQPLQLGGVKIFPAGIQPSIRFKSFTGCIRNLQVDSKVYDLQQPLDSVDSAAGCSTIDDQCRETGSPPCGGHGFCISDWSSARCDCHPGFFGEHCDSALQEWNFERGSWAHFVIHHPLSVHTTYIQLLVRTRVSSSTILHLVSKDRSSFLRLEVVEGHFAVRINFGERNFIIRLPDIQIAHGQWTLVSLERYDNTFTLRIERGGGIREGTSTVGKNKLFDVDPSNVLLGNSLPQQTENDFQGCLRDVRINGNLLAIGGEGNEQSTAVSSEGINNGCHSEICRNQPCQSPFNCIDLWRKYECRCPPDQVELLNNVTGQKQCHISPCTRWSCRNGGTCVVQSQYKYICQCNYRYKGKNCETILARTGRAIGLNSGSILAISMFLLIFIALLVSYTVWSQWGRSKFRKGGVYHIPADHESWENMRRTALNSNDGKHDQRWKKSDRLGGAVNNKNTKVINGYDLQKLRQPTQANTHRLCSTSSEPRSMLYHTPDHLLNDDRWSEPFQSEESTNTESSVSNFQEYVAHIVSAADNDGTCQPADTLHIYSAEGNNSICGSLSSLYSSSTDEDLSFGYLTEGGPKFDRLRALYHPSQTQV
ncbi:neural-cadherin-like [Eleutherodactylus coqui]|uniref:neural-cadherin-like n=1 Tax=Eleutherodactylus coqui TaxID=57060 RepID=UPI0034622E49